MAMQSEPLKTGFEVLEVDGVPNDLPVRLRFPNTSLTRTQSNELSFSIDGLTPTFGGISVTGVGERITGLSSGNYVDFNDNAGAVTVSPSLIETTPTLLKLNQIATPQTISGPLSIAYPTTLAIVVGEISGNARGQRAVDLQGYHNAVTDVASGWGATAIGYSNLSSGAANTAIGYANIASGINVATAVGRQNTSSNDNTTTLGLLNTASADGATAIGHSNTASGSTSVAIGYGMLAALEGDIAIGYGGVAQGSFTTSIGFGNVANGLISTAIGYASNTNHVGAFVIGTGNVTNSTADYSIDMGYDDVTKITLLLDGTVTTRGGMIEKVTTVTNTYVVLSNDYTVICNKATAFTVTLPVAVVGQKFIIKNIGAGAVTVDGDGTDTIDGDTTQVLATYDSLQIQCHVANKWSIL